MITVTVRFLGPAADVACCAQTTCELPEPACLGELVRRLYERYPRLAEGRAALRFAVNREYAEPDRPLQDGDEVAVIPPVSGGAPQREVVEVRLTWEPIDVAECLADVLGGPEAGGTVVFVGTTRADQHPQHGSLQRLEYEAYEDMAEAKLRELAERARQDWPIRRLRLVHRVGAVGIGEVSVLIAVACAHRKEAFAACRWLIDTLKEVVPIWKREVWANGATTWSGAGGVSGKAPGGPPSEGS